MEQQERWEVNRIFETFETWEQFLLAWDGNRSRGVAVGLLYEGIGEVPFGAASLAEEGGARLAFYLKWARQEEWAARPNPVIAVAAQQIIVKHWLKPFVPFIWDEACLPIHKQLLAFLNRRWPSLLAPPYPRFIAEYLLEVSNVWQYGDPARKGVRLAIQNLTDLVVPALCVWGLGYALAVDGARLEDAALHIERWLKSRSSQPSSAMRYISGHGKPLSDFRQVYEVDEEVDTRAALALLKLRYLTGKDVLTGSPTAPF